MRLISVLILFFGISLNTLPLYAQDGDDVCKDPCEGKGYTEWRMSPTGNGTCDPDEDVVDTICCCKPKHE